MIHLSTGQTIDPRERAILDSFRGERNRWRSAWGVARQTGLDPVDVQRFIEAHRDLFVQSPLSPSGITLYGLREADRS